jgi:hypothetical protein
MARRTEPIVDALEELGTAILNSSADDQTMQEKHGWNFPPLSRHDIARLALNLAEKIREGDEASISSKWRPDAVVDRINKTREQAVPHLWDGNGAEAFRTIQALLTWLNNVFEFMFRVRVDWEKIESSDVPKEVARRVRSIRSRVTALTAGIQDLEQQISTISHAHDAALALPTDLETLEEARLQISATKESVDKLAESAQKSEEAVRDALEQIRESEREAIKLVQNTEDAYSAATTKGLGEAFQIRADRLSRSMWVWVLGLVASLAIGAYIAYHRISLMERLLSDQASSTLIWLNIILSILSIAGPVWFAWIATKQIGHRFRLSEDYAFKASVAKAYEGYRREAARLDAKFAAKLFESALDRLDEAPLRFVEHETFGSPWHEILRRRGGRAASPSSDGDAERLLADSTGREETKPVTRRRREQEGKDDGSAS